MTVKDRLEIIKLIEMANRIEAVKGKENNIRKRKKEENNNERCERISRKSS